MNLDDAVRSVTTGYVAQRDALLLSLIGGAPDPKRGRWEIYPDKTETFFWDGEPLIQFFPPEFVADGATIKVAQKYRLFK